MKTKTFLIAAIFLFCIVTVYSQSRVALINREMIQEMQLEFSSYMSDIRQSLNQLGYIQEETKAGDVGNSDIGINEDYKSENSNPESIFEIGTSAMETTSLASSVASNIPNIYPTEDNTYISSYYGYRTDPFTKKRAFHRGIDISVPEGTNVISTGEGLVTDVSFNKINGNYIVIDHGNGYQSWYLHLSKAMVSKGEHISKSQLIGKSGNTGRSTGPHIHYGIHKNGKSINPLSIIR